MKWMVFSDTHLGSAVNHRCKDLYTLVESKQFDRLIILGDFLDLWRAKYSKIIKNKDNLKLMNYVLRELPEQGVEVYYIFGNHEDTDKDLLRAEFPNVKFAELLVNFNIVLTHGNQFDPSVQGERRLKSIKLSKTRQFIESLFHINLRKIGILIDEFLHLGITKRFVKKIHDKVIGRYLSQYKAAIIGHTHCHKQKQISNSFFGSDHFTLYDSGNTYTDLNYFLFENGNLIESGK